MNLKHTLILLRIAHNYATNITVQYAKESYNDIIITYDIIITSHKRPPLVLGHVEGDLVSLVYVSLVIDVSEGVRNEEELSAAFVDDPPHPRVGERLAGLGERENGNGSISVWTTGGRLWTWIRGKARAQQTIQRCNFFKELNSNQ